MDGPQALWPGAYGASRRLGFHNLGNIRIIFDRNVVQPWYHTREIVQHVRGGVFSSTELLASATSGAHPRTRASVRVGELVRELETNERARTDLRPSGETQTKERAIAEAGLSKSEAYRYQDLAGPHSGVG